MSIFKNKLQAMLTAALAVSLLLAPCWGHAGSYNFSGVHLLVQTGEKKAKQVKARIALAENSVQIQDAVTGSVLEEMAYDNIKATTYSKSKHPRWKAGVGLALAAGVFALPLFFMKAKHHWLTFQGDQDYVALRLSKKNFATILSAVEVKTGVEIERLAP